MLASSGGEREVPLADYFTGYRQSVKRPDELIKIVRIPLPVAPVSAFHKIAKRRFDDISSVAVAFALRLETSQDGAVVGDIKIGLGGVAATPLRAAATEAALTGRPWIRRCRRARRGRAGRRGHTDQRPPGERALPHGDAAASRCCKFHAQNPAPALQEA